MGFGSSLRMSRRRGWEDAYLDYASLRLLLTQIEAVYEEQDLKRGGIDAGGRAGQFEHEEFGWSHRSMDEEDGDAPTREFQGLMSNIWRILGMQPKQKRSNRYIHRFRRQQQDGQKQAWATSDEDESNVNSNWVVSASANRGSSRRDKKDKVSHALDKRGWRSPGVTDYRDELFLVSDDDIAFGCCDEDDEWEDTDEEEDVEFGNENYDEYEKRADSSSSAYESVNNFDKDHEKVEDHGRLLTEEQRIHSERSISSTDLRLDDSNETPEQLRYESPETKQNEVLATPDSEEPLTPTDADNPGLLESRYETFATVAAQRGVSDTEIGPGSPEQGWLDFLPNFMGAKSKKSKNTKQQLSKGEDASETSPALGFAESLTPSEHREASIFQQSDHVSILSASNLKFRYDDHRSPLFASSDTEHIEHSPQSSLLPTQFAYKPVTATAVGSSMPPTPPVSLSPVVERPAIAGKKSAGSGFGVSLNPNLIPTSESTSLLASSSSFKVYYGQQNQQLTPTRENRSTRNKATGVSQFQFYSFQNNDSQVEDQYDADEDQPGTDTKRNANMISYYNDGLFSVRSPTRQHQNAQQQRKTDELKHLRVPSLSKAPKQKPHRSDGGGNFIMNFLLGKTDTGPEAEREPTKRNIRHDSFSSRQKRKSRMKRRERQRRQRKLRRRQELVPDNLRVAHVRASNITERFRGLLRAEVEKIILFANSRLGELSDSIGSLSYEEGSQAVRKSFPNLDDGGMHPYSSSDDDEGEDLISSDEDNSRQAELDRCEIDHKRNDSSNEKDAAMRRQLAVRDRLRISRPLFQKAGFLGEDFSLLSAVDENDAYTAIGVELMHLLKFVCVNIIAVRKICKKHDRLLSNRMLGDYYHRQIKQRFYIGRHKHSEQIQPQFGMMLSKPGLESSGGYILGIFDSKIQEIANSTTMQTVSSSLAVALAEFEASQSRSNQLRLDQELGNAESKSSLDETPTAQEIPSPRNPQFTTKRLRDAVSYQISGQCFRADDESTVATPDEREVDEHAKDVSLTRLQYVVTSVFGLREAARNRSTTFDYYASRLSMASIGPNITGDGLNGCSQETLDFLVSYNPDKAYTLAADSLYTSLKVGKEKAMGLVMVSVLEAAASKDASSLALRPNVVGSQGDLSSTVTSKYRNILRINTTSVVLYIANYYAIMPTAYMYTLELDSRSSQSLLTCVTNVSTLIACMIHAVMISKHHSFVKSHVDITFFHIPLMISAICAIFGNILYSYSMTLNSFELALLGRFLLGFGSSELLNRQLLHSALSADSINSEVSILTKRSLMATASGLFFGSVFDLRVKDEVVDLLDPAGMRTSVQPLPPILPSTPYVALNSTFNVPASNATESLHSFDQPFFPPLPLPSGSLQIHMPFGEHRIISLSYVGYVLAILWGFHLLGLLFFYDIPKRLAIEQIQKHADRYPEDEDMDSFDEPDETTFLTDTLNASIHDGDFEKLQTMSRRSVNHDSKHSFSESIISVRRLVLSNVSFPTTIALLFLSKATVEVLLCSGATIMNRYFAWSGCLAGLFLGAGASTILPINMILSEEKNCVERRVIKSALNTAKYGVLIMVNYEAIYFLVRNVIKNEKKWVMPAIYDDVFGILQYIIGFGVVFVSATFLESSTLTLMSKVSPLALKRYSIDNVFIVLFVSGVGRLVGDLLISAVDVSSWIFCSDIINSLLLPLLVGFVAGEYLVRKHYFFLI